MSDGALEKQITQIARDTGFSAVAVSLHDYETRAAFSLDGGRYFYAASTIKVAVLLALLHGVDKGRWKVSSRLHVRNRFHSIADGSVFRVSASRDADGEIHKRLGRARPLDELARAMIVRSSNLATNLLVDFLGVELIRSTLEAAGVKGVEMRRGVEDERAHERGINNEVSADGLVQMFRLLCEGRFLSAESTAAMMEILEAQELNSMIPAALPADARVAHKTGEISTVCHDAGIVYLPKRKPYVLAILTECEPGLSGRNKGVAAISRAVMEPLTEGRND